MERATALMSHCRQQAERIERAKIRDVATGRKGQRFARRVDEVTGELEAIEVSRFQAQLVMPVRNFRKFCAERLIFTTTKATLRCTHGYDPRPAWMLIVARCLLHIQIGDTGRPCRGTRCASTTTPSSSRRSSGSSPPWRTASS